MFRQEKQPNLDDFKRNVRRGSHIALERKKGYYTHHMLVTEVYNNAIKGIEYGSPTDLTSLASVALAKYLGIIHERQINFDELFGPNASDVFLVYCDDYPKTDMGRNLAIERARSRLGEKRYCLTCNNCEHFVTWALTEKPISEQWRNASAFCRCQADLLTALVPEVFSDIQLLAQKYLPNINSKIFSQCLSNLKEKCLKYLPNGVAFDNLRARISSIRELDVLLVIVLSLLKIIIFCAEGGHSVGDIIFEVIKIVGHQICSILLGMNSQLLEIVEKLDLWRKNSISTVDMLRELFKISMSYFVILALGTCILAAIPFFRQLLAKSGITAVVSAAAGFVFDIGHMILSNLLPGIKTLFFSFGEFIVAFDKLRARISSIKELDVLLVIVFSLLKIVIFCAEGGHSVGDIIFEVIKIVGHQICSILLGMNSQLLEIVEKLDLWRKNSISTVVMLRELFKISMSYFEILALGTCIPAAIPFFIQLLAKSGITAVVSAAAGFVFDIGNMILSNLLPRIKTLFFSFGEFIGLK